MSVYELITRRRTIRKFKQKRIDKKILFNCLNAARLAPSASNLQPLEYILITENIDKVAKHVRWAGYLEDGGPKQNEEPVAYIAIISNKKISKEAKYDVGLAVGNIILTAFERGIASCIIGSVERSKLIKSLEIPRNYNIEVIIALGYPKQRSVEDTIKKDIRYWLDEKGILHVPKRRLKEIVHSEEF